MASFKDYYHLTKDSFSIDPFRDAENYFGVAELPQRIVRRLQSDFVHQRSVPKFYVYANYGGGKTHTLAFIRHELTSNRLFTDNHPTEPIYFDIAPIQGKDRWLRIHQRLMDAVGLQRVKHAMTELLSSSKDLHDPIEIMEAGQILRYGEAGLKNSQAQIFRALLFGGKQETVAWDWLKGRALKTEEAAMLSVEKNLSEVSDLVNALLNVATLLWKATGKKPVILMDEGEALGGLTNPDSYEEFHTAFRRLVDDENTVLGLIIAFEGATDLNEAPRLLLRDDIYRRVDNERGTIEISPFDEAMEARRFIGDVLRYLVDQEAAATTMKDLNIPGTPDTFPFTEGAIGLIAQYVTDNPDKKLPSEIISIMADALAAAYLGNGRAGGSDQLSSLITEDDVESSLFPGE